MTCQPLWVILCRLPEKGRKRDRRDSRGDETERQGRKRNRNESEETEEIKTFPSTLTCYKDSSLAQLYANISWKPQWRKKHDDFAPPYHPQQQLSKKVTTFTTKAGTINQIID